MMFLLAATLAFGCKDKQAAQTKPADPPSGSASGSALPLEEPIASGSGVSGGKPLVLPKLLGDEAGKPIDNPDQPVPQATYEKLAASDYIGFKKEVLATSEHLLEVIFATEEKPRLVVSVKAWHCPQGEAIKTAAEEAACYTKEVWLKRKDAILAAMSGGLGKATDTEIELGTLDLGNGAEALTRYQIGWVRSTEPGGGFAITNNYIIQYQNGVNTLRVSAQYKDDPPASKADLAAMAPKEDLAKIARSFFDVYSHAWGD
jgi:hypothetical protein